MQAYLQVMLQSPLFRALKTMKVILTSGTCLLICLLGLDTVGWYWIPSESWSETQAFQPRQRLVCPVPCIVQLAKLPHANPIAAFNVE